MGEYQGQKTIMDLLLCNLWFQNIISLWCKDRTHFFLYLPEKTGSSSFWILKDTKLMHTNKALMKSEKGRFKCKFKE